ncbi:MAG: type IV pilus twitching motility protein PilT [Pelotomaculum sp.]|uniref:Tfp pilus assembly protein, pilus retraction ATPase PilT n=1 Tax=Pelotomaculum thermopropionicum (strain DSM 13744 / JCM 10971 / SI) TaxID=370438 RepID=A5D354_PELTS|nr:type IV pilus twitching motility protein PilT [Pelotomaculum sp.]BAF59327.1 tfp pilus assembly protein, pilus retraction ATPase PilT [Pelotomaculum thermopropionicum SI]
MSSYESVRIEEILAATVKMDGSDLHLTVGMPPVVRIYGRLEALDMPRLMPRDVEILINPILTPRQREELEKNRELDFSFSVPGLSRFRGNIMWQRGTLAVNFRVVSINIPTLEELKLPPVVKELAHLPRGLVLVTGPTGSGKSTTLAAIINQINEERCLNIVTIEDPIEFLHSHKKSIVKQREVGSDTHSFANALRHVLRHDPDVILVGEMRDLESISIAITAAETGHLVFSTLHTQTAPLTIHRIIDVFPSRMRSQISQQLAGCLQAILAQQLIPRADGKGRVAAVEVMLTTPAVRNLIREGKEHQLYTAMQTGRNVGMQTMDSALADLVNAGIISRETALEHCVDQVELERMIRRTSLL